MAPVSTQQLLTAGAAAPTTGAPTNKAESLGIGREALLQLINSPVHPNTTCRWLQTQTKPYTKSRIFYSYRVVLPRS